MRSDTLWDKLCGSEILNRNPPAAPLDLHGLEAKLGATLPPSYRSFLEWSDGASFEAFTLLPCTEVDRFEVRHRKWIDAFLGSHFEVVADLAKEAPDRYGAEQDPACFPVVQLRQTIQISKSFEDGRVLLLNPTRRGPDGEWEAWDFSNFHPGAFLYPSFRELLSVLVQSGIE